MGSGLSFPGKYLGVAILPEVKSRIKTSRDKKKHSPPIETFTRQESHKSFREGNFLPIILNFGNYRCEILGWGVYERRWWQNCLHRHSFFETVYIFRGRGKFRIHGKDIPIKAGQLFIARPGELHEIIPSWKHPMGLYFWSFSFMEQRQRRPETTDEDRLLKPFISSRSTVCSQINGISQTLELLTDEVVCG